MASSGFNYLSQPCINERETGFKKWLSKIFKPSSSRGSTGSQHPQFLGDENMVWHVPSRSMDDHTRSEEEREVHHAIELSLAEDLKRPNGSRQQMDGDEELGREAQDSLDKPSYPRYIPSYPPYSLIPYYPRGYRICGGCNKDIGFGNYLGCMGTFFHPECFCCRACCHPIKEHEEEILIISLVSKN